jgi:hypothetical protein
MVKIPNKILIKTITYNKLILSFIFLILNIIIIFNKIKYLADSKMNIQRIIQQKNRPKQGFHIKVDPIRKISNVSAFFSKLRLVHNFWRKWNFNKSRKFEE